MDNPTEQVDAVKRAADREAATRLILAEVHKGYTIDEAVERLSKTAIAIAEKIAGDFFSHQLEPRQFRRLRDAIESALKDRDDRFHSKVINLCNRKASGYRQSAEGNLARELWIDRAEVMEDFAKELERLQ